MTREQAAKLAQAYQWLSEGKDVELRTRDDAPWGRWENYAPTTMEFRLKPEPLLEAWVNVQANGRLYTHCSPQDARDCACVDTIRLAVHMREVRDEPNT